MKETSRAMRELLERKGISPTGCAIEDMKLAKIAMKPLQDKLIKKFDINATRVNT